MSLIYKISTVDLWQIAEKTRVFEGAPIDFQDGYIHFSSKDTVKETAAKHFAGQDDLLLVAIDEDDLPEGKLVWETSRGGALFPHLYAPLSLDAVRWVKPLPLGADGQHIFPEL
ncbi:DUF952 domain-containing protein [Rhodobacteraceae bacterium RKSG542]|uniref:DUF952 domain-containing protein n=1 Tax=Pseudovibrio flavus TaxID=2529854 RepID=UPI0012BBB55C|nr:DUF952 domain-containing protein [Pseudovibrio flavus]MTI18795.1 DUF952 domain-containing protein [Pseudovibrio flavus]